MTSKSEIQTHSRRNLILVVLLMVCALIAYVVSIAWRVGFAEDRLFGRNHTLPLITPPRNYKEPPVPDSFGSPTFVFVRNGKVLRVYKPLINGFQHTFGSALAAFEIGEFPADILFRANEYFEAYAKAEGRTYGHFIDTRKDLANNAIGRRIGLEARDRGLHGASAEQFMIARVLDAMDRREVLTHQLDPRVQQLPTLEEFGCPGLPHPSSP